MIHRVISAIVGALVGVVMLGPVAHADATPVVPFGPGGAWTLEHNDGGDQLAAWPQTLTGGVASCGNGSKGRVAASDGQLSLSVTGQLGNCAQITSPYMQGYGFIQAAAFIPAKVANDPASWPAFWMVPPNAIHTWPTGGEIDTYEQLRANTACQTYHYGTVGHPKGKGVCEPLRGGWHTFGVWWQRHELRFYLDGQLARTLKGDYILGDPMNILIENKVITSTNPSTIRVLYIRTWKEG